MSKRRWVVLAVLATAAVLVGTANAVSRAGASLSTSVSGKDHMFEPNLGWSLSTTIFLTWDDWGGYYDHVNPTRIDSAGYGLRVPGLVISPHARHGYVDHQTLSFDADLKFIEDDFLGGRRLDPATDGRPDPRPDVRENAAALGDLARDFNFAQAPLPLIRSTGYLRPAG